MGLDDLLSAFAGVNMDDHEQLVGTFARVLGADADQSRFFLEASAWNLESAVGNFLDTVGTRANLATPSAEPASAEPGTTPQTPGVCSLDAKLHRTPRKHGFVANQFLASFFFVSFFPNSSEG